MLVLQGKGFRWLEAMVLGLIGTIGLCFLIEIVFAQPNWFDVVQGFIPRADIVRQPDMLYLAVSIIGATVMPHNLYLHSSIVQTRSWQKAVSSPAEAIRYATVDSTVALFGALFVNAAILIVAAATFHYSAHQQVAEIRRCLSSSCAFAGYGSSQCVIWRGITGIWTKLDLYGNAGRTDCDGRLSRLVDSLLAAAIDYTGAGDRPCFNRYRSLW